MYAPLRLAGALEDRPRARRRGSPPPPAPRCSPSTTPATRSAPGWSSPPTTTPPTAPASATPTTCARHRPRRRFDAVVAVVDAAADTPHLHAPGGLLDAPRRPHGPAAARRRAVVRTETAGLNHDCPLPSRCAAPRSAATAADEVGWLLKDLSGRRARGADRGARGGDPERRRALRRVAAGRVPARRRVPGSSSAPRWTPRPTGSRRRSASSPNWCWPSAAPAPCWCSPGPGRHPGRRADAPLGPHAPRPRPAALRRLHRARPRHRPDRAALARRPPRPGATWSSSTAGPARAPSPANSADARSRDVRPASTREIAVLADPGGCVRTYGTRDDFLIPSACLNSTVSGLVSRTVLRADLIGAGRVPRREVLPRARRRRRLRALPRHRRRPLRRGRRRRRRGRRATARPGPRAHLGGLGGRRADQRGVRHRRRQPGQARRRRDHPGAAAPGAVADPGPPRRRRRPRPRAAARRAARRTGRGGRRTSPTPASG